MSLTNYWFNQTGGSAINATGTWITTNTAAQSVEIFGYDKYAQTIRIVAGAYSQTFSCPSVDGDYFRLNLPFTATIAAGTPVVIDFLDGAGTSISKITGNAPVALSGTHTLRFLVWNGDYEGGAYFDVYWGAGKSDVSGDVQFFIGGDAPTSTANSLLFGVGL